MTGLNRRAVFKGIAATAAMAGSVPFSATRAKAAPLPMRVGWVSSPPSLVPVMFAKKELGRNNGKTYELKSVYFAGSSTGITAMQAGELDIVNLNFLTLPVAVQNAGLADLKVIAAENEDGVGDNFTMKFWVKADSSIKTVQDLKGKVLATIGRGSGVHLGLLAMLAKAGLEENRDYTLIESPFPTMKGLLKGGKADLIVTTVGFASDPELESFARTLFTLKDAFGGPSALSFWAARAKFIAEYRGPLVDFLEDAVRATRWYTDPANRDEAIGYISAQSKLPQQALQGWLFRPGQDFYRDPKLFVNPQILQSNVDMIKQLGVIKENFNASSHVDLSPLQEALARGM
jgi:NitT/TauT family transport system substrate-binding protein